MATDDIVTRLREDFITNGQCDYCEQWEWRGHYPDCPYQSAADEIERLRAENDGLHIRIYTLLKTLEQQAVRGE